MTIHGTPNASLQNAIGRELRKEKGRSRHHITGGYKFIRNHQAYAEARENKAWEKAKEITKEILGDNYKPRPQWAISNNFRSGSRKAVTLPKINVQPAFVDEYQEAEERMKVRAKKAVEMLWFGIEELANARSEKPTFLDAQQINVAFMIATVQRLCKYAQISTPELPEFRKPGAISNRKCLDCGASLSPNETWDLCSDCRPDTSAVKAASEARRERERDERKAKVEVKRLATLIRKVEKGVR